MKSLLTAICAAVLLSACASGPSPAVTEWNARNEARESAAARAKAAHDAARYSPGVTYAQKTAQVQGYITIFLATCDVSPYIQDRVLTGLLKAQIKFATTSESAARLAVLTHEAKSDPAGQYRDAAARDAAGRRVDCARVRARTTTVTYLSQQLAEAAENGIQFDGTNYAYTYATPILQSLETEAATVLANSPR